MSTERLPLFPLRLVLFPGMALPLHIFEERYRQMIGECLTGSKRFGVCLIRAGDEVGEPAEPHLVGTEAEILSVQRLADGRLNLLAVGRRRFRVVEITQWRPYVAGQVAYLPEERLPAADAPLATKVREELAGYIQRLLELSGAGEGPAIPPVVVPRDPVELAYAASAAVPVAAEAKQTLLEETSAAARLEQVLQHLLKGRAEQELLLELHSSLSTTGVNGAATVN